MAVQEPTAQPTGLDERYNRAWELFLRLRPQIETEENIGKHIILDVDSEDYEIAEEKNSLAANHRLQARHPGSILYGFRIGYKAVYAFGGNDLERLPPL